MSEVEIFARLEIHDGLQVLCQVKEGHNDDGEYGPMIVTRCDPNVIFETTEGPWADTADGWEAAEQALREKDLAEFVQAARKFCDRFSKEQQGE